MRSRFTIGILVCVSIPASFLGCRNGIEPEESPPITHSLRWQSQYACNDGILYGSYVGTLKISGLEEGEKLAVQYADTLFSDSFAGKSGIEEFTFIQDRTYRLHDIQTIFRGDTINLSSQDSLYGSSDFGTYHPFPIRFRLGFGTASKSFSLFPQDSLRGRIRCGLDHIFPDTLKVDFNSGMMEIEFWGDVYDNYYDIQIDGEDTTGTEYRFFNYQSGYGSNGDPNRLRRGNIKMNAYIPFLPAVVWLPIGGGVYRIRVEKKTPEAG